MLFTLLKHRVDWERPYNDQDTARGVRQVYQKHQEKIRCLVQPMNARDRLLYGQRNITISHQIFFDQILDLQVGDRLVRKKNLPGGATITTFYVVKGWQDQGGQNGRCFMVEALEQV